ncbi:MAG: sigma-70 family RNA polymerase sigma factor [Acidobacteria bacterium]|nr:sigma-70 family RNA polymerase sigma factor [Acidobacteriota bacterium]
MDTQAGDKPELDEAVLGARFAAGDLAAFETLFRQYQRPVYAWIVRIVRNPAAAEDLTVETFWRIWRSRRRFDSSRPFGAWARRVATHAAIDHLKTARAEVQLPAVLPSPDAADAAERREIRDAVAGAFRSLPARLQAVATLALIEELPYEEISAATGHPIGTIKTRVFRAVRLLRKKLSKLGIRP